MAYVCFHISTVLCTCINCRDFVHVHEMSIMFETTKILFYIDERCL